MKKIAFAMLLAASEEKDRTRTIAIIPFEPTLVELRLIINGTNIHGSFRAAGAKDWREAGKCELPARGAPMLAIQCYQGPARAEHWARISNVTVRALDR